MDLQQLSVSCLTVQVVDVLRNHRLQRARDFDAHHGLVTQIGFGLAESFPEAHEPWLARLEEFSPGTDGVFHEALVAVQRRLAVLGPEPAGPAEGRDAALNRETRPRESDGMLGLAELLRSHVDGRRQFPPDLEVAHRVIARTRAAAVTVQCCQGLSSSRTARRLRRMR